MAMLDSILGFVKMIGEESPRERDAREMANFEKKRAALEAERIRAEERERAQLIRDAQNARQFGTLPPEINASDDNTVITYLHGIGSASNQKSNTDAYYDALYKNPELRASLEKSQKTGAFNFSDYINKNKGNEKEAERSLKATEKAIKDMHEEEENRPLQSELTKTNLKRGLGSAQLQEYLGQQALTDKDLLAGNQHLEALNQRLQGQTGLPLGAMGMQTRIPHMDMYGNVTMQGGIGESKYEQDFREKMRMGQSYGQEKPVHKQVAEGAGFMQSPRTLSLLGETAPRPPQDTTKVSRPAMGQLPGIQPYQDTGFRFYNTPQTQFGQPVMPASVNFVNNPDINTLGNWSPDYINQLRGGIDAQEAAFNKTYKNPFGTMGYDMEAQKTIDKYNRARKALFQLYQQ